MGRSPHGNPPLRLVRPLPQPSVRGWQDGVLAGDERAFMRETGALIAASVRRTLGMARHGNGSLSARHPDLEVDDAVQETFARLFASDARLLRSFDPSRASLATFVTLVARSVTLDLVRRRRHITVPLDAVPHPGPGSAHDGDTKDPIVVPQEVLTGRQLLVLRLIFDEGRPVEQVAAMLGVDAQTVRSTKHKAIERLREYMAERGIRTGVGARDALHAGAGRAR